MTPLHVIASATSLSWYWLWHPLSGPGYQWWSGAGSDISEVALIGAAFALWRQHTCHVSTCHRYGTHPVDGTPYRTCKKHHPTVPDQVTQEHIADAYSTAQKVESGEQSVPAPRQRPGTWPTY